MGSTFPSKSRAVDDQATAPVMLKWRSWPLVEHKRWSWLIVVGVLATGGFCAHVSSSWLLGLLAAVGLSATLWQFFFPVYYEIDALGFRRIALGRTRHISWQAVRAYQLRQTGTLLFQHPDPSAIDVFRSIFIPYPADDDDVLCALRQYLPHAVELPT